MFTTVVELRTTAMTIWKALAMAENARTAVSRGVAVRLILPSYTNKRWIWLVSTRTVVPHETSEGGGSQNVRR